MVDVSRLSRLVAGVQRQVDLQSVDLVVGSLKVGATTPTQLTKAILDNLIALQNGSDFSDGTNSHTHDGRYYTETELDAGQLDTRYYTETELDAGQLDTRYYTETELDAGQLDTRYYTETELSATSATPGADLIGIEAADAYWTGTNAGAAFDEIKAQIGGTTSSTFAFTEDNVLADNDSIYAALDKLDLKWGDLASTATGEGASLIGVEDSAGHFTATNVEAVLAELQANINSSAAGINMKDAARVATTGALPASAYDNGTAGVGATITASANGALPAQDGVTLSVSDRILVKDQAAGLQNGLYIVTQLGDGSNPWILTRATDFDDSPDGEVKGGNLVYVQEGTTNSNTQFILQGNADDKTIGTDPLLWSIFSRVENIVDGDGILRSGTTLSVDAATEVAGSRAAVYVGADGVGIDVDNVTLTHSSSTLQIKDGGVDTTQLATDAVTTAKITDANVTVAKIEVLGESELIVGNGTANSKVDTSSVGDILSDETNGLTIKAGVVDTTELADDAVTDAKIDFGTGAGQVNAGDLPYTQTTTSDWTVADGSAVSATLDEVGDRLTSLEGGTSALTSDELPNAALGTGLRAVRWGVTSLDTPETENRLYLADPDELSLVKTGGNLDPFYVVGLINSDNTTGAQTLYRAGLMPAASHGFTVGMPIYLDESGALTSTAPTTAGKAVVKVGIAKDSGTIDVQIQIMGVV